ncbi:MAG: ABC transporter ATP-binding protein [Bacillota bacterium]|nr:ABC transporter ATP-binding protein [Bacillota bacterium]
MLQAQLCNISKRFGTVEAVRNVSIDIFPGEILAIVGPSGCGKTTLLQIMAGLEKLDTGSFSVAGRLLSVAETGVFVPPEKRGIAMVFQNYALWPHYDVFGNIAYPLRMKRYSRKEQKKVVGGLLEVVRLQGLESRYPHELSGGEQQRVALARALALNPPLLLLDESLSNLDANLRKEMQEEIKRIQRELDLTIIHVTHDQQEAMCISDRIAIMNQGRLVQVGAAEEVYRFPRTEFAASFIGSSNLIRQPKDNPAEMNLWEMASQRMVAGGPEGAKILAVRSEDIKLNGGTGPVTGQIVGRSYHGSVIDYQLRFKDRVLKVQTTADKRYDPGQEVGFTIERVTSVCAD